MPSKNIVKIYVKDGVYHIYNRTLKGLNLFIDEQDYKIFLYYLKSYLSPLKDQLKPPSSIKSDRKYSLYEKIKLLCYCLMPNHFHLMIQQLTERAMVEFMKRLIDAYIKYFNEKYDRRGSIFEGCYKAVLIDNERHFLYLPYYIHHNPEDLYKDDPEKIEKVKNYPYSSYGDYLGKRNTKWIYKDDLMEQFIEVEKEDIGIEEARHILGDISLDFDF